MSLPTLEAFSVQVVGGIVRGPDGKPYTAQQEFPATLVEAIRYHVASGCKVRRNGVLLTPAQIGKHRAELREVTAKRHANPDPTPAVDPFKPPLALRRGDVMPTLSASRDDLLAFVRRYYGPRMAPLEKATFGELRYHMHELFVIPGQSPWKTIPPPPGTAEAELVIAARRSRKDAEEKRKAQEKAGVTLSDNWVDALTDDQAEVLDEVVEKRKAFEEKKADEEVVKASRQAVLDAAMVGDTIYFGEDDQPPPRTGAGSSKVALLAWLAKHGVDVPADTRHAEAWDVIHGRFQPKPEDDGEGDREEIDGDEATLAGVDE